MNTTMISENSLEAGWVECRKAVGDSTSLELVEMFGNHIYSIAKHITQNDDAAGDVLIETFLEVCSDLDGCQEDENVWLRLVTIAVRGAFSKLHNRGESRQVLGRVAESSKDLEHGLRSLNPMCRTVFVLRDIEKFSVESIAKIVNCSVAAVRVCLLRARLQLAEMLTRQTRQQQ